MKRIVNLALFMLVATGCAHREYYVSGGKLYGMHVGITDSFYCDQVDYTTRAESNKADGSVYERVLCWKSGYTVEVEANTSLAGVTKISRVRIMFPSEVLAFSGSELESHFGLRGFGYALLSMGRKEFAKAKREFDKDYR